MKKFSGLFFDRVSKGKFLDDFCSVAFASLAELLVAFLFIAPLLNFILCLWAYSAALGAVNMAKGCKERWKGVAWGTIKIPA